MPSPMKAYPPSCAGDAQLISADLLVCCFMRAKEAGFLTTAKCSHHCLLSWNGSEAIELSRKLQ